MSTLKAAELKAVAKGRQSEPSKLLRTIRGHLDWIVMKCLEKDRTRRYESAGGLAGDIIRHLNNEPIVACAPGKLYRVQRLVRRNRLTVAAATAVTALLIFGLAFSIHVFMKERHARERSESAEREQARLREEVDKVRATEAAQR